MFRYRLVVAVSVQLLCLQYLSCDDCPHIYSRADWNATPPTEIRNLSQIPPPYVVVHHSATDSCDSVAECKALVKSIQRYHMVDLGWEDIGYNFLIGGDGSIFEGRGWGIHGAHVIPYNARSIGICLLGNFQVNIPPDVQLKALEQLISCGTSKGNIKDDYHLIGHRQGSATLCPGDKLFDVIENWPHFDKNPH